MSHLLHDLCGWQSLTICVSMLDKSTEEQNSCDKAKQGLGFPCLLTFWEMSCITGAVYGHWGCVWTLSRARKPSEVCGLPQLKPKSENFRGAKEPGGQSSCHIQSSSSWQSSHPLPVPEYWQATLQEQSDISLLPGSSKKVPLKLM